VAKRHQIAAPNRKQGRKFKLVDRRLKKDAKAEKKKKNPKHQTKVKKIFKRHKKRF